MESLRKTMETIGNDEQPVRTAAHNKAHAHYKLCKPSNRKGATGGDKATGSNKGERIYGSERAMMWGRLRMIKLAPHAVPADGNCQFHAVGHQLEGKR